MGPISAKKDGWETRLYNHLQAALGRPFSWGEHDCCIWSFDVAASLTQSESHADMWRGRYDSEISGAKFQIGLGWKSRLQGCTDLLGPPLASPLLAQRGDLVLGPDQAVGVCIGATCAFVGPDGLIELPLSECGAAWRI